MAAHSISMSVRPLSSPVSRFPFMEATLEELCGGTGMSAAELDAILESMANKGPVMDLPYAGATTCDYCGQCLRACNVKFIGLGADAPSGAGQVIGMRAERDAEVKTEVCLACGVCVAGCERGAISLVRRRGYRTPRRNPASLFARILWEKGRLGPFIAEGLRRRWRLPPLRRR